MSIFFISIPKTAAEPGAPVSPRSKVLERAVADAYSPFLGAAYNESPQEFTPSRAAGIRALCWEHKDSPSRYASSKSKWAIHAGTYVGASLVTNLSRRAGSLVFEHAVWGQYAAVVGSLHTDRIVAWNTSPALEAIHYAQDRENFYLSNRPMLLALALSGGSRPNVQLSHDYVAEYLLYGYSITEQTPFRDVFTLPADRAVHVGDGRMSFHDLPPGNDSGLDVEHTEEEAVDALSDALSAAGHRSLAGIPRTPVQLRLSAGKDSRMLLGILHQTGWDLEALTFGSLKDGEVQIAKALAEQADVKFRIGAPILQSGESLDEKVSNLLTASDGMPPSEAQTSVYEGSQPTITGEPIALGQWPLMKGGLAKKMKYTPQQIEEALKRQGAPLLNEASRERYDDYLVSWSRRTESITNLEKLYLFSRYFRSGRWLQAHVLLYDKDAAVAYPISDAQVTSVSDTLTMAEKLSDRIYHGAQQRIAPDMLQIPLWGSTWRFKGDSERDIQLRKHYTALAAEAQKAQGGRTVIPEYGESSKVERAAFVIGQTEYAQVSEYLTTSMRQAIERMAEGEQVLPAGIGEKAFNKYLWRVFVIVVWLKRNWLK